MENHTEDQFTILLLSIIMDISCVNFEFSNEDYPGNGNIHHILYLDKVSFRTKWNIKVYIDNQFQYFTSCLLLENKLTPVHVIKQLCL